LRIYSHTTHWLVPMKSEKNYVNEIDIHFHYHFTNILKKVSQGWREEANKWGFLRRLEDVTRSSVPITLSWETAHEKLINLLVAIYAPQLCPTWKLSIEWQVQKVTLVVIIILTSCSSRYEWISNLSIRTVPWNG
jgi:hypothetical protein